ncbi:SMC-Scp complex subunit ScpB [Micromonospora radicis]|uniref:SMC-Scp complex subunit ScpB n=1 Tax=Micromonospora radicis TaxID=1894971 RepID=UPI0018F7084A|nr:SMC-Scp complex subunit ScpB [Micromonospora radicis]
MSTEESRDSLAEQAAAWIPPWQRPAPAAAHDRAPAADAAAEAASADLGTELPRQGRTGSTTTDATPSASDSGGNDDRAAVESGDPAHSASVVAAVVPAQVRGEATADGHDLHPDPAGEPTDPEGPTEPAGTGTPVHRQRGGRARAEPEPAPVIDDTELRGALEAILLVVDEPVSELVLAQVLEQPAERIGPMLDDIAASYTAAGHGFELRRAAGGWRLYTRPEYAGYVERFVLDGQSVRLTQAALETLAVVAYKQPVTRSRISAIRGVNCDGVIRTLVSRGLVEECGTESDSGAYLYRTTTMFLEKLGLNSLDDLPPLAPFLPDDVEELADATR